MQRGQLSHTLRDFLRLHDVSTALTTTVMPIKLTSPVLKAKSDMRNVNRPVTTSPPLISFGFLSFAVDFSYSFLYNFSIYLAIV